MSRPRKPFGAQQPGRLPSTMMKVLAAEMSDPARLRRGKQYARDGSVLDIVIEPGVVTCEIQGSRPTPYIASLEVSLGDGMPLRRDVRAVCSCPDDDNWSNHACKHVIATMFVFADELLIEPALLDVWRGVETIETDDDDDDDDHGDGPSDDRPRVAEATPSLEELRRRRRHLQLVREGMEQGRAERRDENSRRAPEPFVDQLAGFLTMPDGAVLPEIDTLERGDDRLPRRVELATILRDAYRHLHIDWD